MQVEVFTDFNDLTKHEWLEGSAIHPDLFAANVEIIPDEIVLPGGDIARPIAEALNWNTSRWNLYGKSRSYGALIKSIDLETGELVPFQVKLEKPIFDTKKGKVRKYENPAKRGQVGGFACVSLEIWQKVAEWHGLTLPDVIGGSRWHGKEFWDWVIENNLPIVITEGMKKACALLSLGYVAIALSGITMGRQTLADGTIKLQQYLQRFATPGREIHFCFDAETKSKTAFDVYLAQTRTGKLFADAGCNVRVVQLPLLPNTDKTGVDDFIVVHGPIALDEYFNQALSLSTFAWQFQQSRKLTYVPTVKLNTAELALDALPSSGLIFVASPKGTGKTKAIGKAIAKDSKVVMLTHLICLGKNLARRCGVTWRGDLDSAKGFGYIDKNGAAANTNRIGLCVHSLLAINPRDYIGCTLVIDEVDQLLKTLISNPLCNKGGKRGALLARFHELVRVAGRVICASADISNAEIDYFRELHPEASLYLAVNEHVKSGYQVKFIKSNDDSAAIAEIIADVREGKRLMISTDSKNKAEAIAKTISTLSLDLRVMLITSDSSGGETESSFIEHINEQVKHWDILIASPSLATGVSIEVNHFDRVYGLFEGVLTDTDISQALARVRQPIDRVVWCNPTGTSFSRVDRSASPTAIANTLKVTRSIEISLIRTSLQPDIIPFVNTGYSWNDNPHLDLFCRVEARQNQAMWNLAENLIHLLRHEGHHVEIIDADAPTDGIKQIIQEAKQAIKADRTAAICASQILSGKDLQELDRQERKTPEDRTICEASRLAEFYCVETLTPELIEFDNSGRARSSLRELESLLNPETATDSDIRQIERQSSFHVAGTAWDIPCHELRRLVREKSGLLALLNPDAEYSSDDLQEFADFCRAHSTQIKQVLNLSIPQSQSNIWIFRRMCDRIAVKTVSSRRWVNGVYVTFVSLDSQNWEFVTEILDRRADHRRAIAATPDPRNDQNTITSPPFIRNTGGGDQKSEAQWSESDLQDLAQMIEILPDRETFAQFQNCYPVQVVRQALHRLGEAMRSRMGEWLMAPIALQTG